MKTWAPEDKDPEFELTPMIDVVFLLIAFFMTLMSFISAELIKLELPSAEQATIPTEPGDRQYISVDTEGNVYFGALETTYEALSGQLVQMKQAMPNVQLYLRADSVTQHRHVNDVMAACAKAGIFDLIFASNKD